MLRPHVIAGLERVEATRRASELRNTNLIEPIRDQDGVLVTTASADEPSRDGLPDH
jgi:hypothetical protein